MPKILLKQGTCRKLAAFLSWNARAIEAEYPVLWFSTFWEHTSCFSVIASIIHSIKITLVWWPSCLLPFWFSTSSVISCELKNFETKGLSRSSDSQRHWCQWDYQNKKGLRGLGSWCSYHLKNRLGSHSNCLTVVAARAAWFWPDIFWPACVRGTSVAL